MAEFKAQKAAAVAVAEAQDLWTPHRPERTWDKFEGGRKFRVASSYEPAGDQPQAIADLVKGVRDSEMDQVLLGVTGSGKTFTMAKVIEAVQRPALILAHNKTLAAQLYGEFKSFFPDNAVEYFVSYYDYYMPEAYVPRTDTYIEKESSINEAIDRMRHSATRAILERDDVIIVASVSCIYGIGSVETYTAMTFEIAQGQAIDPRQVAADLVALQYKRNDQAFGRGTFRMKGDTLDVWPVHQEDRAWKISFFGEEIDKITEFDPLTGKATRPLERIKVYANSHYVTPRPTLNQAVEYIKEELRQRLAVLTQQGKLLEAQRLEQRCQFDIEMMLATGSCAGIENYSRYLTGRRPGEPPPTMFEYLPDNRPLKFDEWEKMRPQTIHVSATPGPWELNQTGGVFTEQIIRPTHLIDPPVEIRPVYKDNANQVDDCIHEVKETAKKGYRSLVTTLTKKMAEQLTEHMTEMGVRVRYMHSDIDTIERIEIIRDLRLGKFDCLVGINLLREGLDIPECAFVGILDADKEGFLRSETSLIQTIGRAARNSEARVVLYADTITGSMERAMAETARRRARQEAHNAEHGYKPITVISGVKDVLEGVTSKAAQGLLPKGRDPNKRGKGNTLPGMEEEGFEFIGKGHNLTRVIDTLEKEMREAAANLEFETAARLRDEVKKLRDVEIGIGVEAVLPPAD